MTTSRETPPCPFTNICDTSGDVRTCSEDMRFLPPLPPAEELCIDALDALYAKKAKKFDVLDASPEAGDLMLRLGGIRLEQGLNPGTEPETAAAYLAESRHYFQLATLNPGTVPSLRLKAQSFQTHLPAFESRRNAIDHMRYDKERTEPPEAHLLGIRKKTARYALRLEDIDPIERMSHVSLNGISLLLARKGILDYPTTKRERGGSDSTDDFRQQAHTSYSIIEGYKLPTFGRYRDPNLPQDPRKMSVSFSHLIERHAPDTFPDILDAGTNGKICLNVVRLLMQEAKNEPVRGRPLALLNALSGELVASQADLLSFVKNQSK